MFLLKAATFFVFVCLNVGVRSDAVCQTPLYQQGTCKLVTECAALYDLLANPSRAVLSFLKKSQCGREGQVPKVCCPDVVPEFGNFDKSGQDLLPSEEECGWGVNQKLIGGQVPFLDQFPSNAILKYTIKGSVAEKFYCGGVLITDRYVLTAAHCVKRHNFPKNTRLVSVRLGEYNFDTNPDCEDWVGNQFCAPRFLEVPIEKIVVHEGYSTTDPNQYDDIALVRLEKAVTFNDFLSPICLPTSKHLRNRNYTSEVLQWAGWGISHRQVPDIVKKKATVVVVDSGECNNLLNLQLSDSQFCGYQFQSYKSCAGDSGGASLDISGHYKYFAAGILSLGSCNLTQPFVFTRVSKYTNWIVHNLEP